MMTMRRKKEIDNVEASARWREREKRNNKEWQKMTERGELIIEKNSEHTHKLSWINRATQNTNTVNWARWLICLLYPGRVFAMGFS